MPSICGTCGASLNTVGLCPNRFDPAHGLATQPIPPTCNADLIERGKRLPAVEVELEQMRAREAERSARCEVEAERANAAEVTIVQLTHDLEAAQEAVRRNMLQVGTLAKQASESVTLHKENKQLQRECDYTAGQAAEYKAEANALRKELDRHQSNVVIKTLKDRISVYKRDNVTLRAVVEKVKGWHSRNLIGIASKDELGAILDASPTGPPIDYFEQTFCGHPVQRPQLSTPTSEPTGSTEDDQVQFNAGEYHTAEDASLDDIEESEVAFGPIPKPEPTGEQKHSSWDCGCGTSNPTSAGHCQYCGGPRQYTE